MWNLELKKKDININGDYWGVVGGKGRRKCGGQIMIKILYMYEKFINTYKICEKV
jgi:hypothetical protein